MVDEADMQVITILKKSRYMSNILWEPEKGKLKEENI